MNKKFQPLATVPFFFKPEEVWEILKIEPKGLERLTNKERRILWKLRLELMKEKLPQR